MTLFEQLLSVLPNLRALGIALITTFSYEIIVDPQFMSPINMRLISALNVPLSVVEKIG